MQAQIKAAIIFPALLIASITFGSELLAQQARGRVASAGAAPYGPAIVWNAPDSAWQCQDMACVTSQMRRAGSTRAQMDFVRDLASMWPPDTSPGWAVGFRNYGRVDLVTYDCARCRMGGFVLVNGSPKIVLLGRSLDQAYEHLQRTRQFARRHPRALLRRLGLALVETRRPPNGSQTFVFSNDIADCEACEPYSEIAFALDFNAAGRLANRRIVGFRSVTPPGRILQEPPAH